MPDEPTPTDDISLPSPSEEPSPPASSPPRILLSQAALAAMREHGYTDTSHECGGVMLGEMLEGGRGEVVLVEAVIAGAHTDNRRGSVTFTHETWEQINQEKDQKYSDLRIVGWYHTHPGFGIFLSDYDQFIQANFFNLPWNIAFVLDPLSGESGAFGWVDGKIARLPEYESYAVADEHPSEAGVAPASQPASEAEAIEADAGLEACATPARRPIRWGLVVAIAFGVVIVALAVLSALGMGLMLRQEAPPALPPVTTTAPPVPTPPPAGETPALPSEAPAPPAPSKQETAPAPQTPHETGPKG